MNLAEDIKRCLQDRGWTATRLSDESNVPLPCITRVKNGERQGMHSKNLQKLLPFLYPAPGGQPQPGQGPEE